MSISIGVGSNLKLSTGQKLTPQLQQAIRLLQMSSLELEQEVQIKLENNPMLEREENDEILDNATSLDSQSDSEYSDNDKNIDSLDKLLEGSYDTSAMDNDASWDNVYTSSPLSLATMSDEDLMDYQGSTSQTIQDHIRWQINFKNLEDLDNIIADYLIDSMDDAGFINLDIGELYNNLMMIASFYQWGSDISQDKIVDVLLIIQSCEPLGVGARNLSECLLLQLQKLDQETPYINEAKEVLKHSEYLPSNDIEMLLTKTGLDIADIEPSLQLIRKLNPAPGQTFVDSQQIDNKNTKSYDIPDVLVSVYQDNSSKSDDNDKPTIENITWQVRLNPETLPKLCINQEYACLVKRGDNSPDNTYLKDNLNDAKLFLRSIEERNHNLLKVANYIVGHQDRFLLEGAIAMQPLILREVAEAVELHESTVSRLTTNKSMLTPQGLYSLKYFFSSSVSGSEGNVSSTAICAIIESLIKEENAKKPLSDKAIAEYLIKEGIDISRRTVAKYRDALNIASSPQRRQRY